MALNYLLHLTTQFYRIPEVPQVDLTGRTVLITGANAGIGFEIARHMAKLSPKTIVIVCRRVDAGEDARREILASLPPDHKVDLLVWYADMMDFASVMALGERANKELGRLDILVSNAGINVGLKIDEMRFTKDGWERRSLHPKDHIQWLRDPFDSKIPESGQGEASGGAKRQDEMGQPFEVSFDQNLVPSLVIVDAAPGIVASGFIKDKTWLEWVLVGALGRTPEVGARIITRAALLSASSSKASSLPRFVLCADVMWADNGTQQYWNESGPKETPSTYVVSVEGRQMELTMWDELLDILEKVAPGCSGSLSS
ncbi:MAG: hypothetical protein TREMPRED_003323 [Tremellales sp. Tagirdzhanova-0007]|nr:MAG: hypothetical protein TREMPRED_003323 [Tremellales sp. Tagirdzhanova-0007]